MAKPAREFLWWRFIRAVLAALGLIVALVSLTPLVTWWARALSGPMTDPKGDILIVLAGSSAERGTIGYNSYLRAQYAAWAYQGGGFAQIIVSGGGEPPASVAMRDFLVSQGVPGERIRVETASHSTQENAINARALLGSERGSLVLLTSDYHMFRARRVFQKAGLAVRPRPIPDVLKRANSLAGRWPAFLDLLGETAKIGYYLVRGWI